jgi:hypothetical protein
MCLLQVFAALFTMSHHVIQTDSQGDAARLLMQILLM